MQPPRSLAEPRDDRGNGGGAPGPPPPILLLRPFDSAPASADLRQGERNTPPLGVERPYFVSRFRGRNDGYAEGLYREEDIYSVVDGESRFRLVCVGEGHAMEGR